METYQAISTHAVRAIVAILFVTPLVAFGGPREQFNNQIEMSRRATAIRTAMDKEQAEMMKQCLEDKEVELPRLPRHKIDKCETILGFDRSGNYRKCTMRLNGSCEVQ